MLSNDAQRSFRSVLGRVEHHGEHVTILRYKTPAAVLVSSLGTSRRRPFYRLIAPDVTRRLETDDDLRHLQMRKNRFRNRSARAASPLAVPPLIRPNAVSTMLPGSNSRMAGKSSMLPGS
jgi:antitoxin (DNA-binding transcriptional repressor) of toxin-antitoxin stability system